MNFFFYCKYLLLKNFIQTVQKNQIIQPSHGFCLDDLGAIRRAPFKSFSAQPADVMLACGVSRHSPASLLVQTSARLRLQKDITSPAGAFYKSFSLKKTTRMGGFNYSTFSILCTI